MEFDPKISAEKLKKSLEEREAISQSGATFTIFVENIGEHKGDTFVQKEKKSGEIVIYSISEEGGELNDV